MPQYKTIHDVKIHDFPFFFEPGPIEIWYSKSVSDLRVWDGWRPDINKLAESHTFLGSIRGTGETDLKSLETIFRLMQGEFWSPAGQANEMVKSKDVHTSMSIADVVKCGDKAWIVLPIGFEELNAK